MVLVASPLIMVQDTKYKTADAVVAILLEAKQVGVYKLTRTALTKYLYLLDYWVAKENGGKPYFGVTWRFHHYGPYSDSLALDLDWASSQPAINKVDVSRQEKDFTLYSLSSYAKNKTLEMLGVSYDVRQNLALALKAFSGDLTGLLNFVYFKTEPMEQANPGDVISFAGLNKVNFKSDVLPIKIPITDKDKAKRIKLLLSKIAGKWEDEHKYRETQNPPIRDSHFAETIGADLNFDDDQEYRASLTFNSDKPR